MKGKILAIVFFSILFLGCQKNRIPVVKLTIIDGIVLGQSLDSTQNSLETLNVPNELFYTKEAFQDMSELSNYMVTTYFTRLFDLSLYRNPTINLNHYGIYQPIVYPGTDKCVGMSVILVSTTEPALFNPFGINGIIGDTPCLRQEINDLLIDEIIKMYNDKYGDPISNIMTNSQDIFVLEGTDIKGYEGTKSQGQLIIWNGDAFTVEFFTGLPSYKTTFMKNPTQYILHYTINQEPTIPEVDFEKGIYGCKNYGYIRYMLKSETIKKLGLDKKKI